MGFIYKFVTLQARRKTRVKALIDTGADYCYISSSLVNTISATGYGEEADYKTADNRRIDSEFVHLTTIIDKKPFATKAIIIREKEREFVIGVKFLQVNSIQIMGERLILPKFPVLKIHRI